MNIKCIKESSGDLKLEVYCLRKQGKSRNLLQITTYHIFAPSYLQHGSINSFGNYVYT